MENIIQRLKTASETCVTTYEAWDKAKSNEDLRETLQEALHELRKSTARLEIEIAVSERKEAPQKPLPIPPHRDANRPKGEKLSFDRSKKRTPNKSSSDTDEDDDNTGNSLPSFISGGDDNNNGGGKSRGGSRRGGTRRNNNKGGSRQNNGGGDQPQESDGSDD